LKGKTIAVGEIKDGVSTVKLAEGISAHHRWWEAANVYERALQSRPVKAMLKQLITSTNPPKV
jgi:hypothetical protein